MQIGQSLQLWRTSVPEATYEILALLMRYIFTALGVLICFRALWWLLREHRVHARERRQLPRAGQIGVLEFADSGERLPLAMEGLVGGGSACDVVIRKRGLRSRHFTYRLQPGRGVEIIPCRGARVSVNGRPARAGQFALSGALIQVGEVTLRLRLLKRLRLPSEPAEDSPDPLLSTWDEDDFLPSGMAIPAPGQDGWFNMDDPPELEVPEEERGKILPLFSDEPPENRS